jgi:hypothetical protein
MNLQFGLLWYGVFSLFGTTFCSNVSCEIMDQIMYILWFGVIGRIRTNPTVMLIGVITF